MSTSLIDLLFSTSLEVTEQEYFSYDPRNSDAKFASESLSEEEEVIISYLGELSDFIRLSSGDLLSFLFSSEMNSIEKDWLLSSQIGVLPLFLVSRKMYFGRNYTLFFSVAHIWALERVMKQNPIRETHQGKMSIVCLTHTLFTIQDGTTILNRFRALLPYSNRYYGFYTLIYNDEAKVGR